MSIPNDIIGSANVSYLGDPFEQYCGLNGKPLIGGHIEVYLAGTSDKYMTLQDFDGDYNPFKVPLGADGRVVMLADPSLTYDIYVYNSYNDLVCSRLNVECTCPGTINLSGADTWIRNTDGTLDISLRTSANNRRVFDVNTRNKLLDVQSPLYFVENSETATVIGFSGDGYLTEDKFEYDENSNITGYDGSAFAGGQSGPTYSAGDYVDITDDTISVTGLQPSGNYASASDVNALEEKLDDKLDVSAFNESAVTVNNFQYEGDKITAYNNSAFAGADYEAGQYVDITDNRISVTGVQPAGNYASASDVTELNNKLAEKLDTSAAFTKASADTLYQPIGEYAPTGDYAYKSDLNDYQPASSMTAYATTSLVSSVSSTITGMIPTGDFELVAGSGVELVDDPTAKTTTINVTAEGGNKEVENLVTANSATWNTVSDKLDTTAFSDVSGSFLTAHQDLSNYATTAQVAEKLDTTAFSTVSGDFLTAHQDISNLMPKSESANFYPMTGNPSGFLTAHQDLSDYQTTAGMTAYATVESLTSKQEAGDYYSASNPSGFLTAVPAGTMNEGNFSYDADDNITAYNGSAFNAGAGGLTVCAFSAVTGDLSTFYNNVKDNPQDYVISWPYNNYDSKIAYLYTSGKSSDPDPMNPDITVYQDYLSYRCDDNLETSALVFSHSYKEYHGIIFNEVVNGALETSAVGSMNESAFGYDSNNKISGYNGSAFAGGSDVPEGVMVESGIEYNAVNEISGYNGSAIAQYGAEKQWLVHDDTLVHASNSAQYALGVNVSAVGELLGVAGPVINQETFAGYWNGQPLYQQLVQMTFSSNSTSTAAIPDELYSSAVANGRRWIDPSNSFIHYGSQDISLPISWMLASDRRGSISIINNALHYRGVDGANTGCTAYVCVKYRKA